jgi:WD40 repeat protein
MLPDDLAVVGFHDGLVVCWDLLTEEELGRSGFQGELMDVVASPRGDLVAIDCVSTPIFLDPATGEGHWGPEALSDFAFSPSGDALYAYDADSRAVVKLDPVTEQVNETGLEFGEPEEDDCFALVCCPTRPLLASGGYRGRVRLGDLVGGRWIQLRDGPPGLVSHLAFTPDGRTLVSGHSDHVVFWDTETLTQQAVLRLPGYGVNSLAFSPDGQTLAVGDAQGVVRLWPWRRLI